MQSVTGKRIRRAVVGASSFALLVMATPMASLTAAASPDPVGKAADPATQMTYPSASASATSVGGIWTDKSVFAAAPDTSDGGAIANAAPLALGPGELGVVLSALGSTRHVTAEKKVPVDLVMILDDSRSMVSCIDPVAWGATNCDAPSNYQGSRAYAMVVSVEAAMEVIADANPDNRVALVQFGTGAGVVQALATPAKIPGTNTYVTFVPPTTTGGAMYLRTASATLQIGTINNVAQSTNLQLGVVTGMQVLASQPKATVSGASQRTPNVLLFTDGEPTLSATATSWWDVPTNAGTQGPATPGDPQYCGNGFKAALAAAYLKGQITDVYNDPAFDQANGVNPVTTSVFTVGLGLSALAPQGRDLAMVTLDPVSQLGQTTNIMNSGFTSAWATYSSGGSVSVPVAKSTNFTVTHPTGAAAVFDPKSLKYDDAAFSPQTMSDLTAVFRTISEQIVAATPTYPVEIEDGLDESTSGYVTFTDPLGPFMRVTDMSLLTFCSALTAGSVCVGQQFSAPTVTSLGNGLVKYQFSGTYAANDMAGTQNTANIVVTVQTFAALARGDIVTVKIPAALLPMNSTWINTDDSGTPTSVEQANSRPVRVYFKVAPKPGVIDALGNPMALDGDGLGDGAALRDYIAAHTVAGTVRFYSDDYAVAGGAVTAAATSQFVPASANDYYRFAGDTPLYADQALTQPLTPGSWAALSGSGKAWFAFTGYGMGPGGPVATTVAMPTTKDQLIAAQDASHQVGAVAGQMTAPQGMLDLARAGDFDVPKCLTPAAVGGTPACTTADGNITATAAMVRAGTVAGGEVSTALGNDGYVAFGRPGGLMITQSVQAAPGLNPDPATAFRLDVALRQGSAAGPAVSGSFAYEVFDSSDLTTPVSSGTVADGGQIVLKDSQTVVVYGLPDGTCYGLQQTAPAAYPVALPAGGLATGTVVAGSQAQADFVNTYGAAPALVTPPGVVTQMVGGPWLPSYGFEAQSCPQGRPAGDCSVTPVPQTGSTGQGAAALPQQSFAVPGTYVYTITQPDDATYAGVSLSGAVYRWVVTVTDAGTGQLTATGQLLKVADDDGVRLDTPSVVSEATFVNVFSADSIHEPLAAAKTVIDRSTAAGLAGQPSVPTHSYEFAFAYLGAQAQAGTPAGSPTPPVFADGAGGSSTATVRSEGSEVVSPQVTFDQTGIGYSFYFSASENASALPPGVTGSAAVWIWRVDITAQDGALQAALATCQTTREAVTASAPYGSCDPGTGVYAAMDPAFENTSAPLPAPVTLTATSALVGRPWLPADDFTYTLAGADAATSAAIAAGALTINGSGPCPATVAGGQASVTVGSSAASGGQAGFCLSLGFSQQGVYQLTLAQTGHDGPSYGMTYDTQPLVFDVVVTDPGTGTLQSAVTLRSGEATFTNRYAAAYTFGGIGIDKTLVGRDLNAGEFSFTLTGADPASADAAGLGGTGTGTVVNANDAADPGPTPAPAEFDFTQDDVGQHYRYAISEARDGALPGVTYDQTSYAIDIAPAIDAATGQMYAVVNVADSATGASTTYDSRVDDVVVAFVNKYRAAPVAVTPSFTKTLDGRAWTDDDVFTFGIEALTPGAPMPATTSVDVDQALASGFGFGSITFTAPGVYRYAVTEQVPAQPVGGVEYDPIAAIVTVTVSDAGTGQLQATMVSSSDGDFVNYYHAQILWGLIEQITLRGSTMPPSAFTFEIMPETELAAAVAAIPISGYTWTNPDAAPDGVTETMSEIPPVTFDQDDVGETVCYDVWQVVPAQPSADMVYDKTMYQVCATVEDMGDGNLSLLSTVRSSAGSEQTFESVSSEEVGVGWPVVPFVNSVVPPAPEKPPVGPQQAPPAVSSAPTGGVASGPDYRLFGLAELLIGGGALLLWRRSLDWRSAR